MPLNMLSYADDTAIISTEDLWENVERKMNRYLDEVYVWLDLNKLSLNIKKTVFITFGNYRDSVPVYLSVQIKGIKVTRVEYCKYLRIIFDQLKMG